MKIYASVLLCLLVLKTSALPQTDATFNEVLESYIREDDRSIDKTAVNKLVSEWPGIRTMDGVRSMVTELLKPTGGSARSGTFQILRRSEVPRAQIVSYLLESAQASRDNLDLFGRYFSILQKYPEDDRIVKYLGGLLESKELFPVPKRPFELGREPNFGAPGRVCDLAHASLIQILLARGEIQSDDPMIGDAGGAHIWDRDRNNAALRRFLISKGLLDAIDQPKNEDVGKAANLSPSSLQKTVGPDVAQNPDIPKEAFEKRRASHAGIVLLISGGALVLLITFAFYKKGRAAKG